MKKYFLLKSLFVLYRTWLVLLGLWVIAATILVEIKFIFTLSNQWMAVVTSFLILIVLSNILAKISFSFLNNVEVYHGLFDDK